ncbi:MAG: efflux RND transporter periplasmic adaptor subunit [Myxococcales bacterium]|nr:efflux RND transporter periplasmic adaptor subunit [Myxococcales bacterium]MCB9708050.1 efflux RND transporter periplasmic adaptor subunit [Myxococcales bacterium]
MKRRFARVCFLASLGILAACSTGQQNKNNERPTSQSIPTPHADEPEHTQLSRKLRLAPEVVASAHIRTAPVSREALAETITLSGEIVAIPDRTARVSSPVAGRISKVFINEGDVVQKGKPLAMLKIVDLGNVQAAYTSSAARAAAAQHNVSRLKALVAKGLGAKQELAEANALAESLNAEASALKGQLTALGIGAGQGASTSELTLRAPLSGTVIARQAVVGQPVSVDASVATISDLSETWFLARVFEKDLAKLRRQADAEVELNAYPEQRFIGKVTYVGKQIDPVARTVTARIPLVNRDDILREGLFGTAHVSLKSASEKQSPVLVVPRNAVTEIGGKSVVFVQHADNDFELHDVVLGADALGKVHVLSGLREGEQVVIDGVFSLKSMMLKGTFSEED